MTSRNMHLDMPSPPDLSSSDNTTPGTSTVVTPSIVLPLELRPLTSKLAPHDSARSPSPNAQNPLNLDLSLPLSTLLRESTKIAHTQAEHSAGAIALAGGTLPFTEYVRYLASLWIVYSVLEREISRHSTLTETEQESDVLALLWDESRGGKGKMLTRSEALARDVEYLVALKPATAWATDPRDVAASTSTSLIPTPPFPVPPFLAPLFTHPPPAITTFVTHLERTSSTRPALLLAHAYVRYLGDLSGGQIVRSRIRRVYALDHSSPTTAEETQDGTQFYEFDIFDSADRSADGVKQPTMYERKQRMTDIKEWFRSVLDSGTADGKEELKRALVDEAIECFHLSTHIFSALRPTQTDSSSPERQTVETSETSSHVARTSSDHRTSSADVWDWVKPLLIVLAFYAAWTAYRHAV